MSSDRDPNWRLRGFARVMRHEPTDGERRLWSKLRDRRLNGHKFRRQVPIAGFIVDFYCMEAKLVVEIDGSQHFEPKAADYDKRRSRELQKLGVHILRFDSSIVLRETDAVCRTILACIEEPSPQPSPGVPGEGVMQSPLIAH